MPARVVVVLDEPELAEMAVWSLQTAGNDAMSLPDSMAALNALEDAKWIELLVTSADCGVGKPNGLALARMARFKRPGIKVIFVGAIHHYPAMEGLGAFMLAPVNRDDLVETVIRMLESDET